MAASTKRARVMARSKKLGHCICDPRKSCPCELFIAKNVCTCAGERLEEPAPAGDTIQLTKLVKNAGCASKIPPAELRRVLDRLPKHDDPRLLVGMGTADDAGVFQVAPDLCLVQTVDVFAPSVDDPYLFGQVAACNSLSDVYAMGGAPVTALSIVGYPIHTLSDEWLGRMIEGGMQKLSEAGVVLVGGHSINEEEIKFGFAVTGTVDSTRMVTNAGAQPGDALILTKKIGTGILAFAAQMGRAPEEALAESERSMSTLNRAASEVMAGIGAHACTDVTGFGVLGHLYNVARESNVTVEIWSNAVPTFPGVLELAREGVVSGAAERNREYAGEAVDAADRVPDYAIDVLYDAQTSGGLLVAVSSEVADGALVRFHEAGCIDAAIVGRVLGKGAPRIHITAESPAPVSAASLESVKEQETATMADPHDAGQTAPATDECCAPGSDPADAGSIAAAFSDFGSKCFAPGALDVIQKELIALALAVAIQCKDCFEIHVKKSLDMGITRDEIAEAAMMGVFFGGCKAMMFWKEMSATLPER